MTVTRSRPPFDDIARRWHDLAERRLDYFTELYRSGRWTRYYASRELFAARMLDVIRAAKTWSALAGRERPQTEAHDDLRNAA